MDLVALDVVVVDDDDDGDDDSTVVIAVVVVVAEEAVVSDGFESRLYSKTRTNASIRFVSSRTKLFIAS